MLIKEEKAKFKIHVAGDFEKDAVTGRIETCPESLVSVVTLTAGE